MGYPTHIEWCDATLNTAGGCEVHSPECINCYAMRMAGSPRLRNRRLYAGVTRRVKGKDVFNGMLSVLPDDHPAWSWAVRWRGAKEPVLGPGMPSTIFVEDMADLFHVRRPVEHIDRTLAGIVYSRHIGILLTKRGDVMNRYFQELRTSGRWLGWKHPLFDRPNFDPACATFENSIMPRLWLGFSSGMQRTMDANWPHLRGYAQQGFQTLVSMEPMLERTLLPMDMAQVARKPWIILGGESGPEARAMHPAWARLVRDDCEQMGLPFFFKQWGNHRPDIPASDPRKPSFYLHEDGTAATEDAAIAHGGAWQGMFKMGKQTSGHLLDGMEHRAFPKVAA